MHEYEDSEELLYDKIKKKKKIKKQTLFVELAPDDNEVGVNPRRGKGRRNYSRPGTGHFKRSKANKSK